MNTFFRKFGKSKQLSDQAELMDFTVRPSGIIKEAEWTGDSSPLAVSIAANPGNSLLCALVKCASHSGAGGVEVPTSLTWNGLTLTQQVSAIGSVGLYIAGSAIYILVNPGVGTSSVAAVGGHYDWIHITAVLLSGVNQSTPVVSTGSAIVAAIETIGLTTENFGIALETGMLQTSGTNGDGASSSPPQTKITGANDYSSYKETAGTSDSLTRTLTGDQAAMVAIAFKPA